MMLVRKYNEAAQQEKYQNCFLTKPEQQTGSPERARCPRNMMRNDIQRGRRPCRIERYRQCGT